ncbi:MAG: phosphoribosylformylglycinamidine synthase, partial [Zetaproteobacteria bacterium]
IEDVHVRKRTPPAGAYLVQLGGPALRIGLGGGAASSMDVGANEEELDFNSVQRDNPEMQRRCQEVLDACRALGPDNPILFIHDVGAGGLSNAIPELCKDTSKGAAIDLARAPSLDPSLSPMELWCNEAQERYVLAIAPERMETFAAICARERCPYAVLGKLDDSGRLVVDDSRLGVRAVDVPLSWLFDLPLDLVREAQRGKPCADGFAPKISVAEAARRVLRFPAVADKTFLVTIADRSVGGLVARDPMVGRWQVPVADCGVTTTDYDGYTGEAIALGERPAVALLDPAASARIAIAEAVLNVLAADVAEPSDIKLSANWMAAAGDPQEDAALFDAVRAASRFCQALGLAIPVGKD